MLRFVTVDYCMPRILLFLFTGMLLSCGDSSNTKNTVYFGGEIVNPTSDYVVLYKHDIVIDSAKLDENNRFSFRLEDIEEGLHHFYQAPEQQYVYFEKGDSILARLNTVAFDESLVFSGSNEQVNNFMIEMFLNYEDEERLVNSFYKLSPEAFSGKIDSLRNQKMEELQSLIISEDLSKSAYNMAKASIDYSSFLYKEKYPFFHKKKTSKSNIHVLKAGFYDYRKNLDFNNKNLTYFRPYYDFMLHHFGNLSYMTCAEHCGMEKKLDKKNHLHLNKHKMVLIDSMVHEEGLKNNLFRNVATDYLLKVHEASPETALFIEDFKAKSSNGKHIEEIMHLFKGIKKLQQDNMIPHVVVEDNKGTSKSLKQIAKQKPNTVFYFWTASQKRHFKNVRRHVTKLKRLYPEHTFIGINLRTSNEQWLGLMEEYDLEKSTQYRSADFNQLQNTLLVDGLNKCVVTKDSLIVNAFAHFFQDFDGNKKALVSK